MNSRASGTFDVKLTPRAADPGAENSSVGRMAITKKFHGELDASSVGQMLAVRTAITESAGYVAMEQVSGTLRSRSGSFALQHSGVVDRGAKQLTVTVVPDSGTDQLLGLAGSMAIDIVDGQHYYHFDFRLPDQA